MYTQHFNRGTGVRDVSHLNDGSASSLYALGYCFANASFTTVSQTLSGILLAARQLDREYVNDLITYLGFTSHVKDIGKSSDYLSARIKSPVLAQLLLEAGCTIDTRQRAVADSWLFGSKIFWRGFIDGNGFIGKVGDDLTLRIQAGPPLLAQFQEFLARIPVNLEQQATLEHYKKYDELIFFNNDALSVITLFYTSTTYAGVNGLFLGMPHMLLAIKHYEQYLPEKLPRLPRDSVDIENNGHSDELIGQFTEV